jgi:predicted GH43/DUF377 family glycosyl hydrolase
MSATPLLRRTDADICPDPSRVVARLYLPGEEMPVTRSRTGAVVDRVLTLSEAEAARLVKALINDFSPRHRHYRSMLTDHAAIVSSHVDEMAELTESQALLLGAAFTAEYAVEAAALCNPSAVPSPDQSGLEAGQVRVALSLRAIGEGHFSSIGFCSAIIGPGETWTFEPRPRPVVSANVTPGRWQRAHLAAVLEDAGGTEELAVAVVSALPAEFSGLDLEHTLANTHPDLLTRPGASVIVELLRRVVGSAYDASFPEDVTIGQRQLMPSTAEESNGMEDARFVQFTNADGSVDYRATYTAYDGHQIAPRLLRSTDLQTFRAYRLSGPAAQNKGMALFPRQVCGKYVSLCRSDGETNSITVSDDGYIWDSPVLLQPPALAWEVLQVGNCGPPIETDRGWLVLTHGVGPMRTYSIGAVLLDLDDPSQLIARLEKPLLWPEPDQREGYVPNVVYSCGGIVVDGNLWLPYGVGDARIRVGWVPVDELLDRMHKVDQIHKVERVTES